MIKIANNIELQTWLAKKQWRISPPFAQWNYWHIIKNDGGILPLDLDWLLNQVEFDKSEANENH